MKYPILSGIFAVLTAISASAVEYIHNGRFLDLEYSAPVHRHVLQPHWQTAPHAYSAFKLLKDVEADVAKSHLNIKCLKAPQDGYQQLFLDTEFIAVPHSPVKITWRARGNGKIGAGELSPPTSPNTIMPAPGANLVACWCRSATSAGRMARYPHPSI